MDGVHTSERKVSTPDGVVAASVGLVLGCLVVAFIFAPATRQTLLSKNGPMEWATYLAYASAAIASIALLRRNSHAPAVLWTVPVLAFLGFLEEISYGVHLFDVNQPTIAGKNINAVHDLLAIVDDLLIDAGLGRRRPAAILLTIGAVALVLLTRAGLTRRVVRWLSRYRPLVYVAATIPLLLLASILDILAIERPGNATLFVEESLELVAAGLVLVAAASIARHQGRAKDPRARSPM